MKVLVITDTHYGCRNDAQVFHGYFKKFIDNVLLPYIDEHQITHVIHLGDLVDRRKYIQYYTLRRMKIDFLKPLFDRNVQLTVLLGNHDVAFKNTNDINALQELFQYFSGEYPNKLRIVSGPETLTFDGTDILMLPWISPEIYAESMAAIKDSKAAIAMGHLELAGFEGGAAHGENAAMFDKFDIVLSGHYHHKSTNGTVFYLGSPWEMDWADYEDPKGFHVFDTDTRALEHVRNPYVMFEKFFYDDSELSSMDVVDMDLSVYKDTYVKIVVQVKNNPFIFDTIINKFENAGVYDLKLVDDHMNMDAIDDADIIDEAEDTPTILKKTVQAMKTNHTNRLTNYTLALYNEALSLE